MHRGAAFYRCAVASILALVASFAIGAPPGGAVANAVVTRYPGIDRYDTARLISAQIGPTPTIVLARGDLYPDALAGAYVARLNDAAILLTTPTAIPTATSAAIRDSGATKVIILGGPKAISSGIEAALRGRPLAVERIAGPTRYETAALAAQSAAASTIGTLDGLRTAIVSSGVNFPDALSASPISFSQRFPILLTAPGALSAPTRVALGALGIQQVLLVGGPDAVSEGVVDELRGSLGMSVTRISGANRSATSVAVTRFAIDRLGFTDQRVGLVLGTDFADALTYGPLAGRARATTSIGSVARIAADGAAPNGMVQAESDLTPGADALAFGCAISPTAVQIDIPGGTKAVSTEVEQQFSVAPCDPPTKPPATTPTTAPPTTTPGTPPTTTPGSPPPTLPPFGGGGGGGDVTPPSFTVTAPSAGATVVTFVGVEPLDPTSVVMGDVTCAGCVGPPALTLANGNRDIVATMPMGFPYPAGAVITLASGSVKDVAGNSGPVAPVSTTVLAVVDATPPSFTVTNPLAGASTVLFVGSEPLDPTTVDSVGPPFDDILCNGCVVSAVTLQSGKDILVTVQSPFVAGQKVTLRDFRVADPSTNLGPELPVVADVLDTTPPTLLSIKTGQRVTEIELKFSEDVCGNLAINESDITIVDNLGNTYPIASSSLPLCSGGTATPKLFLVGFINDLALSVTVTLTPEAGELTDHPFAPSVPNDAATSLTATTNFPIITTATLTTAGATEGFGNDVGDVLTLEFDRTIEQSASLIGTGATDVNELTGIIGFSFNGPCTATTTGSTTSTVTIVMVTACSNALIVGSPVPGAVMEVLHNIVGGDFEGKNPSPVLLGPLPAPTLTSITPGNGPDTGGTPVVVTGTGFQPGATVTFCPYNEPGITVGGGTVADGGTTISLVIPAYVPGGTGNCDLRVNNPDGQVSPDNFTVYFHFDQDFGPS